MAKHIPNQIRAEMLYYLFLNICIAACFKAYCDDVRAYSASVDQQDYDFLPEYLKKFFPVCLLVKDLLTNTIDIYFLNQKLKNHGGGFFHNPPGKDGWGNTRPSDEANDRPINNRLM